LWVIIGLVVLLVLMLCVPVETTFIVDTSASDKYRFRVSWMFGLIHKDIKKKEKAAPKKPETAEKKRRTTIFSRIGSASKIGQVTGLARQTVAFVTDIFRKITINGVSGSLRIGLEDPVLTGIVFAVISPANALLNLHPDYSVSLYPCFTDGDVLEGNLSGNAKLQPVRLVVPVIRFGLSREVRRAGRTFFSGRWKRKRSSRANR
jgi:hypothetical protein